ncbi:MAG: hypothetical protein V7K25_30545 [Nostoc sp.]|uniref:hypothetical protein n=1 Tax=Nostoc sp. TaxID=1180 RepID=UPI002FF89932
MHYKAYLVHLTAKIGNGQYTTELTLTTGTIVALAFGDVSVQVHRLVGFAKI